MLPTVIEQQREGSKQHAPLGERCGPVGRNHEVGDDVGEDELPARELDHKMRN
jgi:hypothetical protein